MKNIEIYRDEEIKVEIDGEFQHFVEYEYLGRVQLTKTEYMEIVDMALEERYCAGLDCKKLSVQISSEAPIIYNYGFLRESSFKEPFRQFVFALNTVAIIDLENKIEIIQRLKDSYKEQGLDFSIRFFPSSYCRVQGFMALSSEKTINILPFCLCGFKD